MRELGRRPSALVAALGPARAAEGQSPSPPASEAVSFEMFRWLLSSGQERALSPRGSMPPSHFFSPSRTSPGNTPCAAGKEPPPRASLAVALTSV